MSDLLTHWAVYDDVRRLCSVDPRIDPLVNETLTGQAHMARLGAISRAGSRWMPPLLTAMRDRRDEIPGDARLWQKLGFALGGIVHFPADQVLKPLMSRLARADWNSTHTLMQGQAADPARTQNPDSIREISAYYDCHVFRNVYQSGQSDPFSSFLLRENDTDAGRALEAFVRSLFQRALLSAHTLAPDMSRFDDWLDALIDRVPPLYIEIELYSRVFTAPDPDKVAAFEVETTFWRDSDPLIEMARAIQRGETVSWNDLDAALTVGVNASAYAECLRRGVQLLEEASAFLRNDPAQPAPPDVRQG